MKNDFSTYSPYKETSYNGYYLDIWTPRLIPILSNDVLIDLPSQFEFRPDLLSYEAYGDARLWWVFAMRNPGIIKDPIYDLVAGVKIYIPQKQQLLNALGTSI